MRIEQEPLNQEELDELRQLLELCAGTSVEFARGVFAAVATAPSESEPDAWLSQVLAAPNPDPVVLKRGLALLLRDYNSCVDCLALGVPAVPRTEDEAAIQQYCKGYVRIAHRDPIWTKDSDAFVLTMPLAVLAGYVEPNSLPRADPDEADPEVYRRHHREALSESVVALYKYWEKARAAAAAALATKAKAGRNDPCPCGSGKKRKKCCG